MKNLVTGAQVLAARRAATSAGPEVRAATGTAPAPLPEYVLQAIAAWRRLRDIPFVYLVPDEPLLLPESIRFFHLDGDWLDHLATGAVSVGATTPADRARATTAAPRLASGAASADPVSGFLLRSALVSRWPGVQVRAYHTAAIPAGVDPAQWDQEHPDSIVPVLRLERLGPSVLLALFDGVPALVWVEEPHHGVQLGVEVAGDGYRVPVRGAPGVPDVNVPMRAGSVPGVIDVAALAGALDQAAPLAAPRGAASLAASLIQPPSRQRFAAGTP